MSPWPTAYTFLQGSGQPALRLIVHKATWREQSASALETGNVVPANACLVVTAGGQTVVDVLELQPAGKRRMKATDFYARPSPQKPGDRLGAEATDKA